MHNANIEKGLGIGDSMRKIGTLLWCSFLMAVATIVCLGGCCAKPVSEDIVLEKVREDAQNEIVFGEVPDERNLGDDNVAESAVVAEEPSQNMVTEELAQNLVCQESIALYLGVYKYGEPETRKENIAQFQYRFLLDGEETLLSIQGEQGSENPYPIQNLLKEGFFYSLIIEDGVVLGARELPMEVPPYSAPVAGIPGEKTLGNFLKTAMEPMGTTLYVYGGGWDWQDEGAGMQAKSIGISKDWIRFFGDRDASYTYRDKDGKPENKNPKISYYPYGKYNQYYYAGLDCSSYIGWVLYNCIRTDNKGEGLVSSATGLAKKLAAMGLGTWTQDVKAPDGSEEYQMKPGDIMSINRHVWISLGTCSDNSVVIAHSFPSISRLGQPGGGVQLSAIGISKSCQAYELAEYYMSTYYPKWYERYPVALREPGVYFTFSGEEAGRFRWNPVAENGFSDAKQIQEMTPQEVLEFLYGSKP